MAKTKKNKIIHQLKQAFLFRDLPEEMLASLAGAIHLRHLKKNDVLFRKGDAGDSLFTIGKGRVKIVAENASGIELTINQCGAGEVIGDMSLFDQAPRSAGVVALEEVDVLELKRDDFLNLLDQRPDVALSVIRGMSARMRYNTTFIQKVTEWSKKIAEGDFSFTDGTDSPDLPSGASDEDRASQFLNTFFSMARNVKEREDKLKKQVEKLTIQIDEERRKKEVSQITESDYYVSLKEKLKALRDQEDDVANPPGSAMRLIFEQIETPDEQEKDK